MDGRLQPVPASRADLFADRSLSLADKRSLGRFMAACVEAAEGSGRLKVREQLFCKQLVCCFLCQWQLVLSHRGEGAAQVLFVSSPALDKPPQPFQQAYSVHSASLGGGLVGG